MNMSVQPNGAKVSTRFFFRLSVVVIHLLLFSVVVIIVFYKETDMANDIVVLWMIFDKAITVENRVNLFVSDWK